MKKEALIKELISAVESLGTGQAGCSTDLLAARAYDKLQYDYPVR